MFLTTQTMTYEISGDVAYAPKKQNKTKQNIRHQLPRMSSTSVENYVTILGIHILVLQIQDVQLVQDVSFVCLFPLPAALGAAFITRLHIVIVGALVSPVFFRTFEITVACLFDLETCNFGPEALAQFVTMTPGCGSICMVHTNVAPR